ncbi:MAG: DUF948 domain-containing protein [Bacteroidetes bacterium]|nr:DUF948 domain-containing protein [Bacteroidota bacterium]
METILTIALIIVALALSFLAVYLVVVLSKLRDVLGTVEINIKEVGARAVPVLSNLEVITSRLRAIMENIDEQLVTLQASVQTIKDVADNVASFEKRIQGAIENPIMEVLNTIGGIIRGFTSFFSRSHGSTRDVD